MQVRRTPILTMLIVLTVAVTLITPILSFLLWHFWKISITSTLLPLSLAGIERGFFWQLLTYPLVHTVAMSLSVSLFITLAFQMLLLAFFGGAIVSELRAKRFLILYAGSTVIAGSIALLVMWLLGVAPPLVGSSPPILALLVVWTMLFPNLTLTFFFLVRFPATAALYTLLGLYLLFDLLAWHLPTFAADAAGALSGLLLGRYLFKLPFPFHFRKRRSSKIIDIGEIHEEDDAFMDRMLDKIGKRGEKSLTKKERDRMHSISRKKRE